MSDRPVRIQRNVNFRPEVHDLIMGECAIRNNGENGFSLTLNQIILEYFDMRTPKGIKVTAVDGKAVLSVEEPA
ncbi:MAG: hypothetical protein ABSG01_09125 [Anaerolineales bacterium]|jgi:hypothetical protein